MRHYVQWRYYRHCANILLLTKKEKIWKRKKERKKTTQKEMMSSHTADVVASISITKDQLATKDIAWIVVKEEHEI